MELYQRIKQRREELGMSQEELAGKLGYKHRSSINKIELGENDIPQSKIIEFSRALDTSPMWLMGWTDEKLPLTEPLEQLREALEKLLSCNITADEASSFLEAYKILYGKRKM